MSETATDTPAVASAVGFPPGAIGITAPSDPGRQGAFLTDVLVELGFIDQDSVAQAVEATRQSNKTPERYLLDNAAIDEWQLSLAVAERNGLDHVDLEQFVVDPEVARLIDKATAARYTALPIGFATDGALLVAIEDPFDMLGISDIEVVTRNEVRPVIATGTQIQSVIEGLPENATPPDTEPPAEPERTPELGGSQAPGLETAPLPLTTPPQAPPPEPTSEQMRDDPVPEGAEEVDAELGKLSAALTAMQEPMSHADSLIAAVERRIGELQAVNGREQQAATALAEERAEFERERQRGLERERELEGELSAARQESQEANADAQQAATALAEERAEFERERQRGLERERELGGELSASQERITALEEQGSKLTAAAERANSATEKLAELQSVLMSNPPKAP